MKKLILIILLWLFMALPGYPESNELTFTILYNNYAHVPGTVSDWGFSCLVEGGEQTILFDTGAKADILMQNVRKLNVDLSKVDIIVLSHNHADHTGGLDSVLAINPHLDIYILQSFLKDFARQHKLPDSSVQRIKEPRQICANVFTTGEMGSSIKEHSLLFHTGKGQVILTGCSHQGIIKIVQKAQELDPKPIYMVLGGMHLLQHSDSEIKEIIHKFNMAGVQKCGATHCTGDRAMALFSAAFNENFINAGTGAVITISKE
ncbi:MAG TPA: MBL fold metallo-hydrolase [bacterium]|nr:MBL fold metallo-hydrolase [bacterium]HPN43334.1 MBL fold metallo-hydrolase [bacterium]